MKETIALVVLAACLAAATIKPRLAPDWLVAVAGAALLLALGILSGSAARSELSQLGPTIAFLAALLALAEGSRRAGVFAALGMYIAAQARGSARRLLALVFVAAAATTAVLSLDATVVLLTPIVFVTAARLRVGPRPYAYSCAHLANSASLLLPVSNLTNLLAFRATGLSFVRFAELMALPWLLALAVEWVVLSRAFARELTEPARVDERAGDGPPAPVFALVILAATLAGFGLSSAIGVAPVWIATAGAVLLLARRRRHPAELLRALQPGFLLFVLALAVVVRAAEQHGLSSGLGELIPQDGGLPALLAVAGLGAAMANLVNNLPATLIMLPLLSARGAGEVLAMLIGVGVGPNLTYVGSLATLLWRRVLRRYDTDAPVGEFTRLGLLVVPAALVLATGGLWLSLRLL